MIKVSVLFCCCFLFDFVFVLFSLIDQSQSVLFFCLFFFHFVFQQQKKVAAKQRLEEENSKTVSKELDIPESKIDMTRSESNQSVVSDNESIATSDSQLLDDIDIKLDESELKSFAQDNAIESEIGSADKLLYSKLVSICDVKLETQRAFLKKEVSAIMSNKEEKEDWLKMINYPEFIICDPKIGIRQDSMIDAKTNEEVLTFPNICNGDASQLRELNLLNTYDSQVYLTQVCDSFV